MNLIKLEDNLKIKFKNKSILELSLIHRSFVNESNDKSAQTNERLEYLGDAVLELIITEYLFSHFPQYQEGDLTSFRAALVKTTSLAETAEILNLGEFIIMSKGEEATGGRKRPYILANTYEAILGAIYLDQGYIIAYDFVARTLLPKLSKIIEFRLDIDSKSKLQEISQETLKITPIYQLVATEGPDHDRTFTMSVIVNGKEVGQGIGKNKQEAEQKAAYHALLKWDDYIKSL